MKIELQYFNGCPNSNKALENVKAAINELDYKIEFAETLVDTDEAAANTGFRGSPTILIDGVDYEKMDPPAIPSLSCRYYQNGLPTVEQIKNRIIDSYKN